MARWLDNAFWNNEQQTSAKAIRETTREDGKVDTQVLTVHKFNPDQSPNPDWEDLLKNVPPEKISQNTQERFDRKRQEYMVEQQKREEQARAKQLEALFEAKLKAFEIEDIKNSKNRVLKSKLRKSKNMIELQAYATLIIMENMNAEETTE